MFVGHYGPALAGKSISPRVPLWVLFLAVQLMDVFWAIFVLLGIEKVRIVPGITATNPLDLYYMPYTHGLITSLLWSLLAALAYRSIRRADGWPAAWIVGAAVFSHWILDFIVHRPDLPLYDDRYKVGLGLWNYPLPALAVEALTLFGGMYLYMRSTRPVAAGGSFGMWIYGLVLLAAQVTIFFGAPPASDRAAAIYALGSYAVFAGVAYWLERKRAPREGPA